ncbi:MAG: hypothetical protein M1537_03100 [Nitrospirae bacterium]|nr:hypothetical protein [Nitrospirota bacterium]MCL5285063.1 hypothetical protein [Nitrospirota bacterium]
MARRHQYSWFGIRRAPEWKESGVRNLKTVPAEDSGDKENNSPKLLIGISLPYQITPVRSILGLDRDPTASRQCAAFYGRTKNPAEKIMGSIAISMILSRDRQKKFYQFYKNYKKNEKANFSWILFIKFLVIFEIR